MNVGQVRRLTQVVMSISTIEKLSITKVKRNKGFRDKKITQFFIESPPKNKFGVKI